MEGKVGEEFFPANTLHRQCSSGNISRARIPMQMHRDFEQKRNVPEAPGHCSYTARVCQMLKSKLRAYSVDPMIDNFTSGDDQFYSQEVRQAVPRASSKSSVSLEWPY